MIASSDAPARVSCAAVRRERLSAPATTPTRRSSWIRVTARRADSRRRAAAGLRVESRILLTHAHLDHITDVELVKRTFDVPSTCTPPISPLRRGRGAGPLLRDHRAPQPPVDHQLTSRDDAPRRRAVCPCARDARPLTWSRRLRTAAIQAGACDSLVGDTLFAGSIGRTDLPGGDYATLIDSIKRVLLSFPDDVPSIRATTARRPSEGAPRNPFLQCSRPGPSTGSGRQARPALVIRHSSFRPSSLAKRPALRARHGPVSGLQRQALIRSSLTNVPFVLSRSSTCSVTVVGHREATVKTRDQRHVDDEIRPRGASQRLHRAGSEAEGERRPSR